jgi:cyclic pyranopterin phosphate synthase
MSDDASTPAGRLSHVAPDGTARMVDVSAKPDSQRMARATGSIRMTPETLDAIQRNSIAKGDVLGVARVAGIMAAKRTAELIPLCHPLPLTDVAVVLTPDPALPGIRVEVVARTTGKTGVEMEALTGATVALLTVYDMAKAMDRAMVIGDISLAEKAGGVGGPYARLAGTAVAP